MPNSGKAILILLAASAAAWADEPLRLDTRNLRLRLVDGKLKGSLEYTLVVGTYHEWNTDPTAVPGLMSELARRTGIRARVNFAPIGLDEDRIRRNPLLIMTGNRFFNLTQAEVANLRRYLQAGGFIYADDCGGADRSFRTMIKKLLPRAELVELDTAHRLFHCFYKLKAMPKVLDLYHGQAKAYAAHLGDRMAVLYTYDTDVPCGWEKNPDGSFVHLLDPQKHEQSYRLGVNVVMYVLHELYGRRLARAEPAATRPAVQPRPGAFLAGPPRTYRMKPQMPCNLIRDIAPAGRYVWFAGRRMLPGEQEGLARFDYRTKSWRLFLDSEGVLADEVNCLAIDPRGLWIGTSTIRRRWNYGLWHYDPGAGRSRRYTTDDGLVDHDVYDLAVDGHDLYVATRSGLARLDTRTGKWFKDPTHSRNYVDLTLCLAVDGRYVWAGRASGLRRYDKRNNTYHHFDASNSPIRGMVNALALDGRRLWVSAPPELLAYSDGKFTAPAEGRPIAAAEVLTAASDRDLLCFGTRTGGLHLLDRSTGKWRVFDKSTGLPTGCVSKVALDPQCIWCAFGEDPLGVGCYDRRSGQWSFYSYRAGIPCDHLYCLAADGESLFVGTMANGIWQYRTRADRWINLNLPHRAEHAPVRRADVYCMFILGKDLWFGTNLGLCRYRPGSDRYRNIPGLTAAVAALAPDGRRILCGTKQQGLVAYALDTGKWQDLNRDYGITRRAVTAVAADVKHVWLGTEQRLVLLNKATGKAAAVPARLANTPVTALLLRGQLAYVGTPHGLLAYDMKSLREVLPSSHVTAIIPLGGGLLVGTRQGVAFLPDGRDGPVFEKKLAGRHVSALAADPGHLWIGTLGHGLVRCSARIRP